MPITLFIPRFQYSGQHIQYWIGNHNNPLVIARDEEGTYTYRALSNGAIQNDLKPDDWSIRNSIPLEKYPYPDWAIRANAVPVSDCL